MSRIAGLSAFGRSSAALLDDGTLRAAAAEELFSRRKNDPAIPYRAFRWCCAQAGVPPGAVDFVVFAEKPLQRFIRLLAGLATGFPRTLRAFPSTMFTWLGDRLWLKSALVRGLDVDPERVLFVDRSLAQASAAFLTSPFDEAAILIVDGFGEWAATTLAKGSRATGSIEVLAEVQHPHSLLFFLEALAHHLLVPEAGGLRWLAPLGAGGEPRFRAEMAALVRPEPAGAYSLDPRYFDFAAGTARFSRRARKLLGDPRAPGQALHLTGESGVGDARRAADLVRSAQAVCEERCLALVREAAQRTGARRLCLGGGLFLDPRILAAVLEEAPFEAVHVEPYLDDAGAAVGAALYASLCVEGRAARRAAPRLPGEGEALAKVPSGSGVSVERSPEEEVVGAAVSALASGKVVGWVHGLPELGVRPRGRRVLLADPSNAEAVRRLRERVKLGEPYVPLAMAALPAALTDWSLCPRSRPAVGSCQATAPVPPGLRDVLSGAVQVDGTALLHEVDARCQPRLARVLADFAARTGRPPLLAQTSFNRAGDPPVLEPAEAVDLLRRSELDVLFWGDQRVTASGRR
jgi:carbamoyltransferase